MKYQVTHLPETQRFEVKENGYTAIVQYELEGKVMDIYHTEVPDPIEGQGIGSALIQEALEYARNNQLRVLPSCPFAQMYLLQHIEYQDLVI